MRIIKKILYIILTLIACLFIYSNIVKAATTVKVTTDTLNLREKPSTDSDILTLLSNGDTCELIAEEGDWYKIKYEEYTGYITKEYAKKQENASDNQVTSTDGKDDQKDNNPINPDEGEKEDEATEITGKLSKDASVKLLPLIYSSNIDTLKKNVAVTIITETNGWTYVGTDTIMGWIRTDCITGKKTTTANNTADTNNGGNSDKNKTTGNDNKTNSDTNSEDKKTATSNNKYTEKTMYTNDSYVNLRKEASTSSDVLMTVEINTKLTVIGESGDWYQVKTSEGNAYVSKELLSDKQTTTSRSAGIRTEDTAILAQKSETNNGKTTSKSNAAEKVSTSTSSSSDKGRKVVEYAKQFLGVPYVYGGASSSGFDCSGFTMYVYKKFGVSMGHGAQMQSRVGKEVKNDKTSASSIKNNLQPGDLVFFLDYETMDEIGHCGIYIGNGNFIHASSGSGYCVKINSLLPGEYYNTRYCAARRVI